MTRAVPTATARFRSPRTAAVVVCALAYLYVFPYQATLNNPNENVRLYMTAALAEEGRYEIDALRERWGWVNDAAVHGGHVYSVKAPGTSLLGVPGYFAYLQLGKAFGWELDRTVALWVCRVSASILPTLVFAFYFFGFLERQSRHGFARDATFVSVLLGSLLYGYGMLFVSHTLSAVVSFAAFMWLYGVRHHEREPSLRGAFLAGLGTASATLFEYPGLACSLPLALYGLYVLRAAKPIALFSLGGILPALAMMHFQWRAFGNPFTPGHLFVESDAFRAAHEQGVYGAVGPSADALFGLLLHPGAGLFPLTPLLVLALPGLVRLLRDSRQRADAVVLLAVVVLTVLAIASMNNWRGGWTIGPRYLALCVPMLALPALVQLDALAARWPLAAASLALGATGAALVASGLPSAYYPHLPPELTRPLPQLFSVLVAHGYAPANALNLLGVFGSLSMLPMLLLSLLALFLCVRSLRPRDLARVVPAGIVCAVLLLVPPWLRPEREPGVHEAVAFITRRFHPSGHDRAARLHAKLRAQASPDRAQLLRLAALYEREGREREAARARDGRL